MALCDGAAEFPERIDRRQRLLFTPIKALDIYVFFAMAIAIAAVLRNKFQFRQKQKWHSESRPFPRKCIYLFGTQFRQAATPSRSQLRISNEKKNGAVENFATALSKRRKLKAINEILRNGGDQMLNKSTKIDKNNWKPKINGQFHRSTRCSPVSFDAHNTCTSIFKRLPKFGTHIFYSTHSAPPTHPLSLTRSPFIFRSQFFVFLLFGVSIPLILRRAFRNPNNGFPILFFSLPSFRRTRTGSNGFWFVCRPAHTHTQRCLYIIY